MKTIALFPGLDGTGDLYAPLQAELSEYKTLVLSYPQELVTPKKIAEHLVANNDFSTIDLFVAESFGCGVLKELGKFLQLDSKPSIFIAGFVSISARYKLLLKGPDFILKAFYQRVSSKFLLNRYCLGNTKDSELVNLLKQTLLSVPYETVIERLRFLAEYTFSQNDRHHVLAKFILAKNDKLLSNIQQRNFAQVIGATEIIEVDAPHFVAQTHASEIAQIIRDSLKVR